ncbi:MAG: hypothetical protein JXB45_04490 [Candidatus Krumholzibacteriota bacterium]|nr:hypothetical protein [Candidatus Krumholzibacteriota bacterium]
MKIFKTIAMSILLGFSVLLSLSEGKVPETASCESSVYEVMSVLLREEYGEDFKLILINCDTEPIYEGIGDFSREQWPGLKKETIDSLIIRNSGQMDCLEANFNLAVEYALIPERQYLRALQDSSDHREDKVYSESGGYLILCDKEHAAECDTIQPDWDNFDKVYPDAQGFLTFSRVGFDAKCSQALLIYSNAYRCSGDKVRPQRKKTAFFVKREGSWKLVGASR